MFGFTVRSKSTASLLSAAILASAMLAPAAFAAPLSAGNSFEIPVVPHDSTARAYYGNAAQNWGGNAGEIPLVTPGTMRAPSHVTTASARQTVAPPVASSTNNNAASSCVSGYRWTETAANGWTLPMPCHS